MPVTLMVWNIERFASGKTSDAAQLDYICSSIAEADPAIFIIIEVQTGGERGAGTTITRTGGWQGVSVLFQRLINITPSWKLVPPLTLNAGYAASAGSPYAKAGYSEAMAVFFRSDRTDFAGPFKWCDNQAFPMGARPPATAYPAPFNNCLPNSPAPTVPPLPQNMLAGQTSFTDAAGNAIDAGLSRSNHGFLARNPFHVVFVEKPGVVPQRTFKIWAVHSDPKTIGSKAALYQLSRIPELMQAPPANQINVLCGDFNVDASKPAQAAAFQLFTDGVPAGDRAAGNPVNFYKRWCDGATPTMLRKVTTASVRGYPPNYDYTKRTFSSLDNILVAPKNAGSGFAVVNRVVGTPYSPTPKFTVAMAKFAGTIKNFTSLGDWYRWTTDDADHVFRRDENYGHIRDTSDHMALVIDL